MYQVGVHVACKEYKVEVRGDQENSPTECIEVWVYYFENAYFTLVLFAGGGKIWCGSIFLFAEDFFLSEI